MAISSLIESFEHTELFKITKSFDISIHNNKYWDSIIQSVHTNP